MLRTNRLEPDFAIATGIHALDAVRFLMGDPISIAVDARRHDNSQARDYSIRLSFENAATAEITLMLNTGLRRESYLLVSEGAAAEATLASPYSSPLCDRGDRQWSGESILAAHPLADDELVDGGFLGEYQQFFRSIVEGTPSTCSLGDAARSMRLAEAVQNGYSGPLPSLTFE